MLVPSITYTHSHTWHAHIHIHTYHTYTHRYLHAHTQTHTQTHLHSSAMLHIVCVGLLIRTCICLCMCATLTHTDDCMENKKSLIIGGLKNTLHEPSNKVKKMLAQTIIAMAHHNYLAQEGGHLMVEFIVRQCAMDDSELPVRESGDACVCVCGWICTCAWLHACTNRHV